MLDDAIAGGVSKLHKHAHTALNKHKITCTEKHICKSGWCPVWNPFIWFLSALSKWDQMWKKKQEKGDRDKCSWRAMTSKTVKENASGALIPSQAGMKGTPLGRGTAGYRRAAQSHRSPTLSLIVMKILGQDQRQIICMENWACSDLHLFRGFSVDF